MVNTERSQNVGFEDQNEHSYFKNLCFFATVSMEFVLSMIVISPPYNMLITLLL